MRDNYTIDMRKQFIRYADESSVIYNNPNPFYPDSRYYRKDKPAFELQDDGREYIPDSNQENKED